MGRIVVGVDGSEHAADALRWAHREAQLHGHELEAVLAWGLFDQVGVDGKPCFDPAYDPADAAAALDAAIEAAVGSDAATAIRPKVVCDLPARALLDAAGDADLLVVGPRGLGGLRELLLGSVSAACLHHAPCPVAVVRGATPAATGGGQRIVVGVDGSEASDLALRWALAEARVRGAAVHVVHAWSVAYSLALEGSAVDVASFEKAARTLLDRTVAAVEEVAADEPAVPIRRVLLEGPAAVALLGAAEVGDLLVVGSRGVGGFRGLLLGSVSHQVAHHAGCPVVVVPPPRPDRP